jgi:hypothetical protein
MIGAKSGGRVLAFAGMVAAIGGLARATPTAAPEVVVYKTPSCGCCKKWIEHLRANGFLVTARDTSDLGGVAAHYGVPSKLTSCHTALVGGHVVEGHVPADVIQRLLKERPNLAGVAVPGMPAGSPGMESETPTHFRIFTFEKSGATAVYGSR